MAAARGHLQTAARPECMRELVAAGVDAASIRPRRPAIPPSRRTIAPPPGRRRPTRKALDATFARSNEARAHAAETRSRRKHVWPSGGSAAQRTVRDERSRGGFDFCPPNRRQCEQDALRCREGGQRGGRAGALAVRDASRWGPPPPTEGRETRLAAAYPAEEITNAAEMSCGDSADWRRDDGRPPGLAGHRRHRPSRPGTSTSNCPTFKVFSPDGAAGMDDATVGPTMKVSTTAGRKNGYGRHRVAYAFRVS